MRDVLGTIQADQDAIIRAGSRGASWSTVARARARPSSPCTAPRTCCTPTRAWVTTAAACCSSARTSPTWRTSPTCCPSLGEEGVQTCTLRDLVPEGAAAAVEPDPEVARLKSTAEMVTAIEPAVRLYEEPPTAAIEVETPWSDIRLTADDWAEAFGAPDPGTPHNEARDQVWDELVTILVDKHDDDEVSPTCSAARCSRTRTADTFDKAWPVIEPTDLVGDLWTVPAYLRRCAPWLSARRGPEAAARRSAGLDRLRPAAAGRRPAAARRPRGVAAPAPTATPPWRPSASRWTRSSTTCPTDDAGRSDVDAADAGHQYVWSTRCALPAPTRTCSPVRSRTSLWTRPRS